MRTEYRKLGARVAALVVMVGVPATWAAAQGKGEDKKAKLPAAVAKAIEDNRPGAEIDKVDVEKEAGITFYDIEFKADQGEIDVAEDGTVLDVATVIDIKDVPSAVAAAIHKARKGVAIRRIERSEVRAKIEKAGGKGKLSKLATPEYVYEAELAKGEVEVAADGRVIKVEKGAAKQ